jgi:hypothetical protein
VGSQRRDEKVIETAVNGGARLIASFNTADMQAGAGRFGIAVQRPAEVLKRMGS